jgi:hypothetical protein
LRDELGFLLDADPARRAHDLAEEFLALISRHGDALVARYGWLTGFPRELHAVLHRCFRPKLRCAVGVY